EVEVCDRTYAQVQLESELVRGRVADAHDLEPQDEVRIRLHPRGLRGEDDRRPRARRAVGAGGRRERHEGAECRDERGREPGHDGSSRSASTSSPWRSGRKPRLSYSASAEALSPWV